MFQRFINLITGTVSNDYRISQQNTISVSINERLIFRKRDRTSSEKENKSGNKPRNKG